MKIAALGDSLTYGYPYGPEHSWLSQVGNQLGVDTINHGVNGALTKEILQRVHVVTNANPDVVIVMGGTNDAYERFSTEIVIMNLQKIIQHLKENQIPHIFLGIPPIVVGAEVEKILNSFRIQMKVLAQEENIQVIDFHAALATKGLRYLVDTCHPNRAGYEKMAEVAYEALKNII